MIPSQASPSRTRCPLPSPPMLGLHDIVPILRASNVTSATDAPRRAAAAAASTPAWPPPITMTSKLVMAARLAGMFHVEHSLSDAEPRKQGIEHCFDADIAGDSCQRDVRSPQCVGDNKLVGR